MRLNTPKLLAPTLYPLASVFLQRRDTSGHGRWDLQLCPSTPTPSMRSYIVSRIGLRFITQACWLKENILSTRPLERESRHGVSRWWQVCSRGTVVETERSSRHAMTSSQKLTDGPAPGRISQLLPHSSPHSTLVGLHRKRRKNQKRKGTISQRSGGGDA